MRALRQARNSISWKPVKLGIRSAFRVPLIDGRLIDTLARVEGEARRFGLGDLSSYVR